MSKSELIASVPYNERAIPIKEAKPWFKVSDSQMQLEGLCFDGQGHLFFVDVFGGGVYCLSLGEMELKQIASFPDENPATVKRRQDGRLFVCFLGDMKSTGSVISMNDDGSDVQVVVDSSLGYVVDDLTFDKNGGFYFTDFKGYSCEPTGGVYYVAPDYQTITKVMGNMAVPNGVALNLAGDGLWVTEMSQNRLHYLTMTDDPIVIANYGSSVPYNFTGLEGPDSICIDAQDHLYVAMYMQGRVMVFDRNGNPIEQVLIPERINQKMMRSTSVAIHPDKKKMILCSNDGEGDGGSWLYSCKSLSPGIV